MRLYCCSGACQVAQSTFSGSCLNCHFNPIFFLWIWNKGRPPLRELDLCIAKQDFLQTNLERWIYQHTPKVYFLLPIEVTDKILPVLYLVQVGSRVKHHSIVSLGLPLDRNQRNTKKSPPKASPCFMAFTFNRWRSKH